MPIPGLRRVFRLATRRAPIDADVEDELAFHHEMTLAELRARGLDDAAARAEAARRFGDASAWRAELRAIDDARERGRLRRDRLDALRLDLRFAARGLRRSPGLVTAVVLTLALGIGANATMFGIVDWLLLRPPAHVVDPERTGRLYVVRQVEGMGEFVGASTGYVVFDNLRRRTRSFARLAAVAGSERTLGRGGAARLARVGEVSGEFFALLGPRPALGRFFGPDEDRRGAGAPVLVLSWDAWRRDHGGDERVLGRAVTLDGRPYTVVGVAPRGFTGGTLRAVEGWIPMSAAGYEQRLTKEWATDFGWSWLNVVGRLRPGVTREQAAAELTAAYRAMQPERRRGHAAATVVVGDLVDDRGPKGTPVGKVALWLSAVAAVVLLIACANVANLLLARAVRRERELAVQLALGVGSARLVRQFALEGAILALAGGAAALLVGAAGGRLVASLLLPGLAWTGAAADGRVLAVTGGAVALTALLIGFSPAVQARRTAVGDALRAGARGTTARVSRLRAALTVVQATLSVLLLVGAGLFVRSLRNARALDLGFDVERVVVASVNLRGLGWEAPAVQDFWRRARERVAALPGVAGASVSATVPFRASWSESLSVPGWDSLPAFPTGGPYHNPVTPEFLRTMGTRVLRGRDLTPDDRAGGAPVAIVNAPMARRLWPGGSALGRCFHIGADTTPCVQVVGIAEEARRGSLRDEESLQYYIPLSQAAQPPRELYLFARARGADATLLVPEVRRALQSLDPALPYPDVEPMQALVDPEIRPWRLGASLFGAFGLLALAVAAVGLYGVLAYDVAQRRHELGVRVALGARARDVLGLVVGRGVRLAALGVALGLALAAVAAPRIGELLFRVSPRDPATLAGVAGALLVVALAASAIPGWRAARVDPNAALRSD